MLPVQKCPSCGSTIPFSKTQIGLGKPFACHTCHSELLIPRRVMLPVAAVLFYFSASSLTASAISKVAIFLATLIAVYFLQTILTPVRLVRDSRE